MIEDLTIEKLIEYSFTKEQIEKLKDWDKQEQFLFTARNGCFWASNIEQKIYSGKDALRKYYFRDFNNIGFPFYDFDLITDYYVL